MIPEVFIEHWRKTVPWQMTEQTEQHLVISRALVDLYNDPHVKDPLVFRDGTALNKLFINPPARYSESIDFVQKNSDPIGQTIDAIRELLKPWLGDPKWKITQRSAKLTYKYESVNKIPAKLKIEINTIEHFQVLPLKTVPFSMDSNWFIGSADIITYEMGELMATKLRALYQRRKGRDLFDVWYVADRKLINLNRVFDIFSKYCSYNDVKISGEEFLKNLELKKNHRDFHMPIPEKISKLTGITNDDVAGKEIDWQLVSTLLKECNLVICHNSSFDRNFLEIQTPEHIQELFKRIPFACTLKDIDWDARGYGSAKLDYLNWKLGYFYDSHRALTDCWATLNLLLKEEGAFEELKCNAKKIEILLCAINAPYDNKDLLKERKYKWSDGNGNLPKCWWTIVSNDTLEDELTYLDDSIFCRKGASKNLPRVKITAHTRYSFRSEIIT